MSERRPLVLVDGTPAELPLGEGFFVWLPPRLAFAVDEIEFGQPIQPSKTPIGPVLRYYNGLLLRPSDEMPTEYDADDSLTLVYLAEDTTNAA